MVNPTQHYINGRLSLRAPQAESLDKLVNALTASPEMLDHDRDVEAILETLKAEFSTLEDFTWVSVTVFCLSHRRGKNPFDGGVYRLFAPKTWHS